MAANLDAIPSELKDLSQWTLYKLEDVEGKITKVPYQPNGQRASTTDPKTWSTFNAALMAYQEFEGYDGIAFMLAKEGGLVFVDLDDCFTENMLEDWADDIIKELNSYTEISQSGEGIHIIIRGTKPGDRCRSSKYPHKVEIYSHSRQCCTTGNTLEGYNTIELRQDELNALYNDVFKDIKKEESHQDAKITYGSSLSDQALILKAQMSKNGQKFKDLWDGSLIGYHDDHSAADMALMNILAYWTRCDAGQMERLFSDSGLGRRDKWRYRDDYRDRTINEAISNCTNVYEPPKDINVTQSPEEIRSKALEILEHGNPIEFILDSCERFVLGSRSALKKLICCKTIQFVPSSQGLHAKLSGESGSGKTWTVLVFLHHLNNGAYIKGGLSPKALAYHNFGNKLFIFLDEYVQNDDLDKIIKETTSDFHSPYTLNTVANQKALPLHIGSEMTWAISSVDSDQDSQLLNRAIPLNVDDSKELTKKVNERTIEAYCKGQKKLFEDETVLISREMFRILADTDNIPVIIPFGDRIEWLDVTNRRNPSIFMDLLVGITAMNFMQRNKDSEGNYESTEDDFGEALKMFCDSDADELVKRFSKKERQMAENLVRYGDAGLTPKELSKIMNISTVRISQIARGDHGKSGLLGKLPGFEIEEMTVGEDRDNEGRFKKHVRRVLYKLSDFEHLAGFGQIVRLRPIKPIKQDLAFDLDEKTTKQNKHIKPIKDIKLNNREESVDLTKKNSSEFLSSPKNSLISLISATDTDSKNLTLLNGAKELNQTMGKIDRTTPESRVK